ncbi:hypothetical protein [Brevibacillus porteri]|uniref:hypothetical protein n=1 Tax=Brevibacillus porteri TaxID=2126350 RepID=UPI003D1C44D5
MNCFYCNEDKSVLISRPARKVINGESIVAISVEKDPLICLECLKTDLEALDVDVEYEMGI